MPELIRSTGCAGVEEQNQMYRKEIEEVLQKQFSLAKEEDVTLRPLRKKHCDGQILTPDPDRHLMSTTYAVSAHDCVQSKIMRSTDKNVF